MRVNPEPEPNEEQSREKRARDAEESFELHRERLPDERRSVTHKFTVDTTEGYLIVGLYPDGRPAELLIKVAKEGSTLGGLMNTIGILTSLLLQHGVPLSKLAEKLERTSFPPSGYTKSAVVREASSLVDYIFQWMEHVFSETTDAAEESQDRQPR